MRHRLTSFLLLICSVAAVAVVPWSTASAGPGPALPPANAKWDYQIGKPYIPRDGVTMVSRDRKASPLAGAYSVCYVNAYQTQPGAVRWWKNNHPRLLLRHDGKYVVDGYWGEILFDIRTPSKRHELASVLTRWINRCGNDGFKAIEPDNLDSWTRSRKLITRDDAFAYARLLIGAAHDRGLAIAQKNAAGSAQRGANLGFDFAIAEECGRWHECGVYRDAYANQVYVIEYRLQDFRFSCDRWGDNLSIILRDRMVTAPGSKKYVYKAC